MRWRRSKSREQDLDRELRAFQPRQGRPGLVSNAFAHRARGIKGETDQGTRHPLARAVGLHWRLTADKLLPLMEKHDVWAISLQSRTR